MTADEINRFIEANEWTVVTAMPDNPHSYLDRAECNDEEAFKAFVLHIREHGYPVMYHDRKFMCFDVGELKYWTMGYSLETTTFINRAQRPEFTAITKPVFTADQSFGFRLGIVWGERRGRGEMFCDLVEERFGPLPPDVRERAEKMSLPDLVYYGRKILRAQSLSDLGLDQ